MKLGGKDKRKVGRGLRGKAGLRKGFWRMERREPAERENLRIYGGRARRISEHMGWGTGGSDHLLWGI